MIIIQTNEIAETDSDYWNTFIHSLFHSELYLVFVFVYKDMILIKWPVDHIISYSQLMNTSRQVGLRINWVIIDSKICISCTWEIQILHNIEMHILHMRNAYLAYRRGQDMLWKPGLRQVGWARCPWGGISINYFRGELLTWGKYIDIIIIVYYELW